jgi:thiamine-phosphate pyrophosphorylase
VIPRLHLVTDDRLLSDPRFIDRAQVALAAGGANLALHVRGPRSPAAHVFALAQALRSTASQTGSLLVVNDRVDVALALGLAAHLGERSLPVAEARALLGPDARLGASVHDPAGAEKCVSGVPDFLIVGTLFPTASHPERPGAGVSVIEAVVALQAAPVLGIGGVTVDRVGAVLEAGAHGVAVRSGVWSAIRPSVAVANYLDALQTNTTRQAGQSEPRNGAGE